MALLGIYNVTKSALKLLPPDVYSKDFLQEYLIGRALLSGINPYKPLTELAARLLGPLPVGIFPNPSPHPPPAALLSVPLGLLGYREAATLWLLVELTCSVLAINLLLRQFGVGPARSFLIALAIFTWNPFYQEFAVGQLTALLLLLLTCAWLALRSGRDVAGGAALGLCLALKLMGWPLIILLLWKKRWRALTSAAVVAGGLNVAALAVMGLQTVTFYYLHVSSSVMLMYRTDPQNFSVWSVGSRLFEGTGTSEIIYSAVHAPPLYHLPALAPYASMVFACAMVGYSLRLALRVPSFDCAYAVLICCSVIINPVAWYPYLILLLVPLAIALKYFRGAKLYALIAMLFCLHLSISLGTILPGFIAGIITLTPLIAVLLLMRLLSPPSQILTVGR